MSLKRPHIRLDHNPRQLACAFAVAQTHMTEENQSFLYGIFFSFFFREIQLTFKFFFAECWNFQNAIAFSNNLYFTQFFTIKVQNSKVLVQKCFQNYKNQPKKSPQQQQCFKLKQS